MLHKKWIRKISDSFVERNIKLLFLPIIAIVADLSIKWVGFFRKMPKNKSQKNNNDRKIDNQLQKIGLRSVDIIGDGNCFFRSLSHQLEKTESNHAKYRSEICAHMRANGVLYSPFVQDDESFETHLNRMTENKCYGGNMEIVAASRLYKVHINVHQLDQAIWVVNTCDDEDLDTINILYHTSFEHYSSVLPIDDWTERDRGIAPVATHNKPKNKKKQQKTQKKNKKIESKKMKEAKNAPMDVDNLTLDLVKIVI